MIKSKTPQQILGLMGIVSLLSYAAAVVFSPRAYPGYQWMAQAVSDLSADAAPSRGLWNQLSALYLPCGVVCCTLAGLGVRGKGNRPMRLGVRLFAVMLWISAVGYAMFPLSQPGAPAGFQGTMHLVVTGAVVALSVAALGLIIYGALIKMACLFLGWSALIALIMMLCGAVGTGVLPAAYFGIPERFSVFAAALFNAALGVALFRDFR